MDESNLTPVFPPNVLPVRDGVYLTQVLDVDSGKPDSSWLYSRYDSALRIWGCSYLTPGMAQSNPDYEFAQQNKQWRGLAAEPR